jgi:hypothetical protein
MGRKPRIIDKCVSVVSSYLTMSHVRVYLRRLNPFFLYVQTLSVCANKQLTPSNSPGNVKEIIHHKYKVASVHFTEFLISNSQGPVCESWATRFHDILRSSSLGSGDFTLDAEQQRVTRLYAAIKEVRRAGEVLEKITIPRGSNRGLTGCA